MLVGMGLINLIQLALAYFDVHHLYPPVVVYVMSEKHVCSFKGTALVYYQYILRKVVI